jgi:hypothetical protein
MKHIGVLDLLALAGFKPGTDDVIVRHQHDRYPVQQLLTQELLPIYQAYQSRSKFHRAKYVLSFYGVGGTRACLFGVFRNMGYHGTMDVPELTNHPWEKEWRSQCKFFYDLERVGGFEHLEHRVIIDWGKAAVVWCQKISNKPVLELTAPGRRLPPFRDYLEFHLSYDQLQELFRNEEAHREWCARLSAIAGVYLVLAETRGKLYVGSATGAEGIWGRWREYAKTGHGGNILLRELTETDKEYPKAFRFSVLQILPRSMTREDVIEHEARFKAKLGCLAHGLNSN